MLATLRNHEAAIHNLETQVGQIAKLLSERSQGALPRNTEVNPRNQVNAVIQTKERDSYSHELEVISEVTAREVDDSKKGATRKDQCSKVKEYVPCIPYPARLKQTFKENNYGKLEKLFDKLHLSLPFFVVVS